MPDFPASLPFVARDPSPRARRLLTIAQNLRDLAARDTHVAEAATARLAELAPLATELLSLLQDRDPFARSGAARQLRNAPAEDTALVVDALLSAIDDPNDHVVEAALGSLGVMRAEAARIDVRACLDDPNPRIVHAAVFALGRIGPSEEGQHIVRFLSADRHHLQVTALHALTQVHYVPAVPAIMQMLQNCQGAARVTRSDFELPRRIINALVVLRAVEAVPLLIRLAQTEVGVRGMAVQALIDLRAEPAAPALLPLLTKLHDSQHEERLVHALLYLMTVVDYRFAQPEVRRFLTHRLGAVRCSALKAVARWQDREAAEQVRNLCYHDPSAFVRPCAVACLGRLCGAAALPDLRILADDANPLVRNAVADALGRLAPLPEEGLIILTRMLDDETVAQAARTALARHDAQPLPAQRAGSNAPFVPPELQGQVPAARAFLRQWQSQLAALDGPAAGELRQALTKVLDVLAPVAAAA
jgi:HEAT repeat protein